MVNNEMEPVDPWVASMKMELSSRMRWVRDTFQERRKKQCTHCHEVRTCFVLKDGKVLCPGCQTAEYERGASALATYEVQNWCKKQEQKTNEKCELALQR